MSPSTKTSYVANIPMSYIACIPPFFWWGIILKVTYIAFLQADFVWYDIYVGKGERSINQQAEKYPTQSEAQRSVAMTK